ncbi:MAG: hypothetical protein NTW19_20670 [Planctomycetota bacterium]|nr:hypothetical protein [Planctomycetota bacterium]
MAIRVSIVTPASPDPAVSAAAAVLERQIRQRCAAMVSIVATAPGTATAIEAAQAVIRLELRAGIGVEGFAIEDGQADGRPCLVVAGNDRLGLLYGVGKLLRDATWSEEAFAPGAWRGKSVPVGTVRGIYLASHMMNFYEAAPPEALHRYIEEMALWGTNAVILHCPLGTEDPAAPSMHKNLEKYRGMMRLARSMGLRTGFLLEPNVGREDIPPEIRYSPYPDDLKKRGDAGMKVCPSKPAGRQWLLDAWTKLLANFDDLPPDFIGLFPYDAGGCGCAECWPWGSRGFLSISRAFAEIARQKFPACRFVLSAWMFDMPPCGEWEGLAREFANGAAPIDFIMADDDEDFPHHPLEKGVPGGLPLLNFPEITMWGMWPWGGYGANPLPARFQRLWGQVRGKVAGGFPYSEGIWDDINKAIVAQFYWDPNRPAAETLAEYARYEYGPESVDDVLAAVAILERTQVGKWQAQLQGQGPSPDAFDHLQRAAGRMTPRARAGWRWRILFLRSQLDRLRLNSEHRFLGEHWPTPACVPLLKELIEIYHGQGAANAVRPPLLARLAQADGKLPAPESAARR